MTSLFVPPPVRSPLQSFGRSFNGFLRTSPKTLHLSPLKRSLFFFPSLAMASSAPRSSSKAATGEVDGVSAAFQLIRAHQERVGYPSGSMVDFACDHDGSPILAISSLAVHSKNLLGNPKCSLLVAKDPDDRTDTVITLYGDAISVSENDNAAIRTAYLKRHPDAFWVDFGDFRFIHIKPTYVRYVSGVATALLGSAGRLCFNAGHGQPWFQC